MGNKINVNLTERGCNYARWMELAQNHVQWLALIRGVLNVLILNALLQTYVSPNVRVYTYIRKLKEH
jgi:hypothetical protein